MSASFARRLVFFVAAVSVPVLASAQPLQWWRSETARRELALTTDQSTEIDKIFQAGMIELRRQKDDLDSAEAKLSQLIETDADEVVVTKHIDRVEIARAALNKTRTLMLLHMRQALTPEQRTKLTAMRERTNRDRDQRERDRGRNDQRPRPDTQKD
jgi:Spy/CpxP family protein refolding chaperone